MRLGESRAQTRRFVGHQNQMDVVGHQAIAPHRNPRRPAALRRQCAIFGVVVRAEKDLLPPVAALGDVVRNPRNDDPCQSCYQRMRSDTARGVN